MVKKKSVCVLRVNVQEEKDSFVICPEFNTGFDIKLLKQCVKAAQKGIKELEKEAKKKK